jgi:hypothetical protein
MVNRLRLDAHLTRQLAIAQVSRPESTLQETSQRQVV